MEQQNGFARKTYYSQELKHQICKDHIDYGLTLRECLDKYNLIIFHYFYSIKRNNLLLDEYY